MLTGLNTSVARINTSTSEFEGKQIKNTNFRFVRPAGDHAADCQRIEPKSPEGIEKA